MSYTFKNLHIEKIAIIGAGQIGPDIALHFAKNLAAHQVHIALIDISEEALLSARNKILSKLTKAQEKGTLSGDAANRMMNQFQFTRNYEAAASAQIVVEAATENSSIKEQIFADLEKITGDTCIFLSNSSHLQPEVIFKKIANPSRCLVAHYFFPAEINPIIELVPSDKTDPGLLDTLFAFYESLGKIPIKVQSMYGYAIDPIFEGLCQTAIMCHENGEGTVKEIDSVAEQVLGLGVGPFKALNLTGGNPITAHGLDELGDKVLPWFKTPSLLHSMNIAKQAWDTAKKDEDIQMNKDKNQLLSETLQGAYFALSSFILDTGIVQIDDLNMACELALAIQAPFTMMNRIGLEKSYKLVEKFCSKNPNFPLPRSIVQARQDNTWNIRDIRISERGHTCVLTIRRPKVLNALNLEILTQIQDQLEELKINDQIKAVIITGQGRKAFVSGADLHMITELKTPAEGIENSRKFQSVLNYLSVYPKPIVCALNGFAFGGGNELALACTARIASKDVDVLFGQPEVKLGFIPGGGGTQRLPRLIGLEKASEILRTGRTVSAKEALEIGYLDRVSTFDLLDDAIALSDEILKGSFHPKIINSEALNGITKPSTIEIKSLSKIIDKILTDCIYNGWRMPLKEALESESSMFGECMKTKDMAIGLQNFLTNGPKVPASFVHE